MQQANISVSTLKCDPYDDSVTLDDLDSKIKDNSANIAINTGNITKSAAGIRSQLEKLKTTQPGTVWFDVTRLVLKEGLCIKFFLS